MAAIISFIYWNVSPEIMNIGPISLRWYGLLFALGFIFGYIIMGRIYKKEKKPESDLEQLSIYAIIGTVVGARLGHTLFYDPVYYLSNPVDIIKVWEGGLASHGAAIGILIAMYIFSKKKKDQSMLWILDRLVIVVALAGSLIRLGNLFNSEIIGTEADLPWAFVFAKVDELPRHPAQLYESITYFFIFILLAFLYFKKNISKYKGVLFGLFLTLVFSARFIIEFVKKYQSEFEQGMLLNMGQLLSIPFILTGLFFLYKGFLKAGKK